MQIEDWGLIDYMQAYERQKSIVVQVIDGGSDRLIFCEHPPVLTLGRMTDPQSLLYSRDIIQSKGVQIYPIDRGGDVTLHAPGQLVVYPIINLNRPPMTFGNTRYEGTEAPHWRDPGNGTFGNDRGWGKDLKIYMQKLEQMAVDLLKDFGILAVSIPGKRGVFVPTLRSGSLIGKEEKIISIGVGVRKWVTYHGLGINVSTDLSLFDMIKPCGLDVRMTSMQKLLGTAPAMGDVKANIVQQFQKWYGFRPSS